KNASSPEIFPSNLILDINKKKKEQKSRKHNQMLAQLTPSERKNQVARDGCSFETVKFEQQVKNDEKGVELEEKKLNHSVALEEKKWDHGIKQE
ncbi:hypothetical protein VP01_14933g1, partial [Puccinia sorghi]